MRPKMKFCVSNFQNFSTGFEDYQIDFLPDADFTSSVRDHLYTEIVSRTRELFYLTQDIHKQVLVSNCIS